MGRRAPRRGTRTASSGAADVGRRSFAVLAGTTGGPRSGEFHRVRPPLSAGADQSLANHRAPPLVTVAGEMTTKSPHARVIDERQHSSDHALRCCSDQVSGTVVSEQVVDGLLVGGEVGGNVHMVQCVCRVDGHYCRFNGENRRIQRPKGSIPTRRQRVSPNLPLTNLCNTAPVAYRNQIVTHHDIGYVREPESHSRSFRYFYRTAPPLFLRKSRAVLTVSEFSKTELTASRDMGAYTSCGTPAGATGV